MPSANFRAGVVAVVTNSRGQVLAFERSDIPDAWQLPQGGIDVGETPRVSVWRELAEETGLDERHVDLVGEHAAWLAYEFPERVRSDGKRLGQVQRWFTFRIKDDEIAPTPDHIEFVDWRWVEPAWLVEQVVDFRQPAYRAAFGLDAPAPAP